MELAEVVMNPARQRIFQYLLVHDTATVKALPDIPAASLYRHVKILMEHGVLQVVEERRVRGTVESVYRLDRDALKVSDDGTMVQAALLRISAAFAKYFAHEHGDPSAPTGQEGQPPKNREKEEENS